MQIRRILDSLICNIVTNNYKTMLFWQLRVLSFHLYIFYINVRFMDNLEDLLIH